MTIYIEYVIINNLIIDYMLLKATFSLTRTEYRKRRLFPCSLFGAFISLIYPLLEAHFLILTLVKVLSGALIVLLANDYKKIKYFYINALVFFFCTFLTGGAIIGVYNLFGVDYSIEIASALIVFPVYAILKGANAVFRYLLDRRSLQSLSFKVKLFKDGKSIEGQGYLDTGNRVYNGNSPVVFCSSEFCTKFLGDSLIKTRLKKIELITANGKSQNYAFKLDNFILYDKDKVHIFNNVSLCVAQVNIQGYQLILHPDLIKENDYENAEYLEKVG